MRGGARRIGGSRGTGDDWQSRRSGIKDRKRKNKEDMEKVFEEQDIRTSLRGELESGSSSESEDLEEYGRLLKKDKEEWYKGLEKEVQEDVDLEEEDEVIVGSDGQVLGEPEVLEEEVQVERILYDAVVELEDVIYGKKAIVEEEVEQEEEDEEVDEGDEDDWEPEEEEPEEKQEEPEEEEPQEEQEEPQEEQEEPEEEEEEP